MKRFFLAISLMTAVASTAQAQESWSDSVPRVMKIARNCPVKVRDKNGEWANFKDPLPVNRNVVGAINPRRPDMVFFQLARDSKFMFAAPRTCFEGESEWNIAAEEEKLGYIEPQISHRALFVSLDTMVDQVKLGSEFAGGTTSNLRTRTLGACLGGSWEKRSVRWYYGFGGCVGMGKAQYKDDTIPDSVYGGNKMALYGSLRGTAYYDFLVLPYAAGVEVYTGFLKAPFETPLIDYRITPSTQINYGIALGWRFYWEKMAITPKIVINKLVARNSGIEVQFAYLFGGR